MRQHGRKDVPEACGFPFNAKEDFVVSPETVSDAHPRRPLPVAVATLLSQVGTVARMGRPLLDGCSLHYTERAQDRFATKSVIAKRRQITREHDFVTFLNHGDRSQLLLHTSNLIVAAKRSSASDRSVRSPVRNSPSSTGDRPALAAMVWSGSSLR